MRRRLKYWLSKLNTTKGKFLSLLCLLGVLLSIFRDFILPGEKGIMLIIYCVAISIIVISIAGILVWMYIDTRRELKAQKPEIQLVPLHEPIRDKKDKTIGIERFYDMNIYTWGCPQYKTLTLELKNVSYYNEKEQGHVLLSPPIIIWRGGNVKPNSYNIEIRDLFHYWSTTGKMIIANQWRVKLKRGIEYETDLEIKDDKGILDKKHYDIRLKPLSDLILDLVVEEVEVIEAGAE